jgi:hypothetical protein
MDSDGTRFAAIVETTSFLHHFNELPDHRQAGKVDYPLPEVLLLILLAVLAGAEAFTDIARFGERKIELLRRFRPYVNGTPSHGRTVSIVTWSANGSRPLSHDSRKRGRTPSSTISSSKTLPLASMRRASS